MMLRRGVRTIFKRNTRIFQRNLWKSMPEQPVRQADTWDAVRCRYFSFARRRTTTDLEQKKQNSNRHKSISESLIKEVPVIEVDGTVAMCDGGTYDNLFLQKRSRPAHATTKKNRRWGHRTPCGVHSVEHNRSIETSNL